MAVSLDHVWPVQGVIARILEFWSEARLVEGYRQERKHSPPISSSLPSVFVLEREWLLVPATLKAFAAERMCWKLGAPAALAAGLVACDREDDPVLLDW